MESRTPFRGDLPAGTYTVRFELGGYMSATRTVTVSTNRTLDLAAVLERSRGPEEDRPWTIPELGTEMLPIPAGGFVMGSPADERGHAADEDPSTRVTITRPFWLGKYDVT
jgi:formylglycine-generating enzyme required for sulfatase activity